MDESKILKCIWLNCVCEHSPKLIHDCVSHIGTAEEIYNGNFDERKLKNILGYRFSECKKKDLKSAEEIYGYCNRNNIRIIHISEPDYPILLKNTDVPPQILYMKGDNLNLNDYLTLSVVGTRRCNKDSVKFTKKLCFNLAREGIIVVSGMAIGLDAAAHSRALEAGQKTIAVLAGGVDTIYPPQNENLYYEILNNGIIISERPPEDLGGAEYYQERNRIISGLSYGTVIVEGHIRSGTSITANYAQEYDRDVFAVPGRPTDYNSYVPNSLLKVGAIVTTSAEDILSEYNDRFADLMDNGLDCIGSAVRLNNLDGIDEDEYEITKIEKEKTKKENRNQIQIGSVIKGKQPAVIEPYKKPDFKDFDNSEQRILEYLYKCIEPAHIDEIMRNTGMRSSEVSSTILILQMKGAVSQHAGNLYSLSI